MVIKYILSKYAVLLIVFILSLYVINHTVEAYYYLYNDGNIIDNCLIYEGGGTIEYNYSKDNIKGGKWYHHMNSIGSAYFQKKSLFFELDIIIDDYNKKLIVAHDESEMVDILYLDEYFADFDNIDKRYFWLDVKNLNENNYLILLNILETMVNKYSLHRNHILIESTDYKVLDKIYRNINDSSEKYLLSWYYILDLSLNETLLTEKINQSSKAVSDYYFDFISSDIKYYRILNKVFQNKSKLYWYLGCGIERKYKRMLLYSYVLNNNSTYGFIIPACK